ncbi:MAG: hypothetical protein ACOX3W_04110 [Christensenellaceae bacterium]|jgi:hypothetical protein
MKIWATLHKNHKIIKNATVSSDIEDPAYALLACMEQVYKLFDLAEPVWVSKHAKDISQFGRTRFYADDFLEPINFDWFEIESIPEE